MRKNEVGEQTAAVRSRLSLVGRSEPPKELIEKILWRLTAADLDPFVLNLEIAREVYATNPDLVKAPKLPEHVEALIKLFHRGHDSYAALAEDDMAEVRENLMADPVFAAIVTKSSGEVMADSRWADHVMDEARKLMHKGRAA